MFDMTTDQVSVGGNDSLLYTLQSTVSLLQTSILVSFLQPKSS